MFGNIFAVIKGNNPSLESCRSCGHKISKEAVFCPYCGQTFGQINSSLPLYLPTFLLELYLLLEESTFILFVRLIKRSVI
ncbi:zinc ribbon domain-containing protein [Paenibacillus pabuli]|uniref:zinc ribbon domain-containing protein n=1 Tax=Paenibacillus pabuli TaxID=1472 RepID=UPI00350E336F